MQQTAKGVGESNRKSVSGTCVFHPGMCIVPPKSPNLMYPGPEANPISRAPASLVVEDSSM